MENRPGYICSDDGLDFATKSSIPIALRIQCMHVKLSILCIARRMLAWALFLYLHIQGLFPLGASAHITDSTSDATAYSRVMSLSEPVDEPMATTSVFVFDKLW